MGFQCVNVYMFFRILLHLSLHLPPRGQYSPNHDKGSFDPLPHYKVSVAWSGSNGLFSLGTAKSLAFLPLYYLPHVNEVYDAKSFYFTLVTTSKITC